MTKSKHPYDPNKPVFVRIGSWHPSETSRNYAVGDTEAGVSVYDLAPGRGIVIPPDGEWSMPDLKSRLKTGEPRYLLQGDWVGTGGDGEPLLRNIRVIGHWLDDLQEDFRSSISDFANETILTVEDALRISVKPAETPSPII